MDNSLDSIKKDELLEKLQKEWSIEEFVDFNEFTLNDRLQRHPFMLMKFQQKLENEKFQLNKLLDLKVKIEGEAFERIQRENDLVLKTSEIEKYYLPRDEKLNKIKETLSLQTFIVSYFEMTVKVLNSMSWTLKNFIDSYKI